MSRSSAAIRERVASRDRACRARARARPRGQASPPHRPCAGSGLASSEARGRHAARRHQRCAARLAGRGRPRVLLLGEDIRSPYGGAFKVTRGLSDDYPDRVINTPISEAGIVGIANGLALGGRRPIVEIMFGDFLGLVLRPAREPRGQVPRHVQRAACRARSSSARRWAAAAATARRTVRTSRSTSSAFRDLRVVVLHGRARLHRSTRRCAYSVEPTLIIENKLLYRERGDAASLPDL